MKIHRERDWRCTECKRVMNASTTLSKNPAPPREGDVTVCVNCAAVYFRVRNFWRLAKTEDWLNLTVEETKDLIAVVKAITVGRKQ